MSMRFFGSRSLSKQTPSLSAPLEKKRYSLMRSPRFVAELAFVLIGITMITISQLYISDQYLFLGPILNVLGGLIAVILPTILYYKRYTYTKEVERNFIIFIEDLTSSLESGMTLPTALEFAGKRDYGALNQPVREMAAQVDWGIPFRRALTVFANKLHSATVRRSVTTIIETYKAGGKITTTLRSIAEALVMIDKIKKERSASVHSQVLTSYMIFFVFIFILIVLQSFLIPALSATEIPGLGTAGVRLSPSLSEDVFAQSFVNFIVIQGFFAGLVTGKLSEGSMASGLKHSILLIAIGYTVFSIFSQIQFTF